MGLFSRTCAENVYETTWPALHASGASHARAFVMPVDPQFDSGRIAHVLRAPVDEVEKRRYRAVERSDGQVLVSFFGAAVPRRDLDFTVRRVCASQLAHAPYHRAIWSHALVPFCHVTGEWLMSECPQCSEELGWQRSHGISVCDNPECRFDLSSVCGFRVDAKRFDIAAPIVRLLDPDANVHQAAQAILPEQLAGMERGFVFDLIWRFGMFVNGLDSTRRGEVRHLDRDQILDTLVAGAQCLDRWPSPLSRMLEEIASNGDADEVMSNLASLRKRIWSYFPSATHRAVLKSVVPHLATKDRTFIADFVDYAGDAEQGATLLGVSTFQITRLRRLGLIDARAASGQKRVHAVFSLRRLEELKPHIEDRSTLGSVTERLGIPAYGIEQLVCMGQISAIPDGIVQEMYRGLQVSKSDVDDLIEEIESSPVIDAAGESHWRPLRKVLVQLGGGEKPWGPIIGRLRDRRVRFRLVSGAAPLARRIQVAADQVAEILRCQFERSGHAFAFETAMSRRDAEEVLNLYPRAMGCALKCELASTILHDGRLCRTSVLKLAGERISGGEILARWGSGRRMPAELHEERRFPRLGPTGWDRRSVEDLFAKEAGKRL
ncbi:hypothetical protein [Sphingobium yanoikuyae]|uniref:hypothetical protein n=1 Tax=Sphingobium yanoikuyae TaxID=13690 RepID=UPI0014793DCF|nr:hypothetical protein [Sphingobium yanoikuyae]